MIKNKLKKFNRKILSVLFLIIMSVNIFANDGNAKENITVDVVKNNQKIFDDDGILSGKKDAINMRKTAYMKSIPSQTI